MPVRPCETSDGSQQSPWKKWLRRWLKQIWPVTRRGCIFNMAAPRSILLTGASGFVGRHLRLALSATFPDATLVTPAFDVCDAAKVSATVRSAAPDCCVHLAAISTIAGA